MAPIPVIDPDTNPYAVLGVSRGATSEQIKHAYRTRAKAAHPDAGGSPEAMDRLNRAYEILGSAAGRRDFDRQADNAADAAADSVRTSTRRHSAPTAGHSPGANTTGHTAAADRPRESPQAAATRAAEEASDADSAPADDPGVSPAERRRQARAYVWSHVEEFGWLAAASGVILSFAATRATTPTAWMLGLAGFVALYWLVLQLVYMAVPDLKLTTFDTIRSPVRATPAERRTLAVVATLWLPLGLIWAVILAAL